MQNGLNRVKRGSANFDWRLVGLYFYTFFAEIIYLGFHKIFLNIKISPNADLSRFFDRAAEETLLEFTNCSLWLLHSP